jgi:quinol monooxygenase YgiN
VEASGQVFQGSPTEGGTTPVDPGSEPIRGKVLMFSLIVHLEIDPLGRAEFLDAIRANAEASVRDEPGCLRFDVCSVDDDPTRFVLYELYADAAAFADHKVAPHFADWRTVASRLVREQRNTAGELLRTHTTEVLQ